ncbi:MAG: sugar phosphate isomerase/epimerase [Clostridia bacterium]|nr:sugar phosphate isomerase/epimerase [Clostridia bacterium]
MSKRKISIAIGKLQNMFGDKEALRIAKEIGADAVDFDLCSAQWDYRKKESVYSRSDEEIEAYFKELRQYADTIGIVIGQTHGRITGIFDDKEYDEAFYENARLDCLATAAMGVTTCVMHSVTTIHFGADADPQKMRDLNFEMFTRIVPYAKQYGVKIATETFGDATGLGVVDFFGQYNEFIKSYHRVCAVEDFKNYMTICMDTGHCNKATRFGQPATPEFIRMLGKEITVLHLNDNDTLTDQHKMPLSGCMNWNDIFDALDEIGYDGIYNMELNLAFYGSELVVDTAQFAVKVLRRFLDARYGD